MVQDFNLNQYLAEHQDSKDSVAPYVELMFHRETKTAPATPYIEYPKAVTLPDGSQKIANNAKEEAEFKSAGQGSPSGSGDSGPSEEEERDQLLAKLRDAGKSLQGLGNASLETLRKRAADLAQG